MTKRAFHAVFKSLFLIANIIGSNFEKLQIINSKKHCYNVLSRSNLLWEHTELYDFLFSGHLWPERTCYQLTYFPNSEYYSLL